MQCLFLSGPLVDWSVLCVSFGRLVGAVRVFFIRPCIFDWAVGRLVREVGVFDWSVDPWLGTYYSSVLLLSW